MLYFPFNLFNRCILLFPISFLLFFYSSSALTYSDKDLQFMTEYLSDFIEEQMDEKDIPGLSLSLVDNSNTVWQKGFGYSNKKEKLLADSETVYAIGSLTTLITATAIMHLIQNKKFNLDDKIATLIPEVLISNSTFLDRSISVRDLLTHHSGLANAKHKGMWSSAPEHFHTSIQHALSQPSPYPAMTLYSHSNIGYSLLGIIIEKFSHKTYQNFINENVLPAMELSNTGFYPQMKHRKKLSLNYKEGEKKEFLQPRDTPALGLYSNAEDLGKLAQFFLSTKKNHFLNPSSKNEMLRVQNANVILDIEKKIGLGWSLGGTKINNAGLVIHRYGTSLFHRSRIVLMPEHDVSVVVIANDSTSFRAVEEISNQIVTQYLKLKHGIEAIKISELNDEKPLFTTTKFAQRYATRIGLVTLQTENQHLKANVMGWNFKLNNSENKWFTIEYRIFGMLPLKLDWIIDLKVTAVEIEGLNYLISYYKGTQFLFGQALTHTANINTSWGNRIGEYELTNSDELSELYEVKNGKIKILNKILVFEHKLPFWFPLHFQLPIIPLNENQARIAGVGTGYNETIQITKNNDTEFINFSGYLLKRTN